MKFTATYDIEPVAQGRPRFNKLSGRAYDPIKSRNFKKAIAILTRVKFKQKPFKKPIKVTTKFYRLIPVSTSKKRRELMEKARFCRQQSPMLITTSKALLTL
ncbi:RusA family crossover junction endodeoxyribonuclease [Holzapfeliella sp. He02]|uniref:RusA family crossover junction endodeoxyribonuclease n=1 Tax=Holzapfeliella saturejae TaxID=3082953 RepID=UPI0030ED8F4B